MSEETGLALAQLKEMSKDLSTSKILPQALQNSPANIYLILMTGRDMGLAPTTALRMFDVVDGKISMRADGMAALVKRSGYCKSLRTTTATDKECVYEGERTDLPGVEKFSFTLEDAKRAGLLSKKNWTMYPADMLRARSLARICRAMWPDVVGGLYDADELTSAPPMTQASSPVLANELQSAKERVAKHLQIIDVVEQKTDTALPVPPPPPPPAVIPETPIVDAPKEPFRVLAGELKGEHVECLTQDQCYSVIQELEAKLAESPKARWASSVKKHVDELRAIAPKLSPTTEPTEEVPF